MARYKPTRGIVFVPIPDPEFEIGANIVITRSREEAKVTGYRWEKSDLTWRYIIEYKNEYYDNLHSYFEVLSESIELQED